MIDDRIVITVIEVRGDKVRIGIQAPREVPIHRNEVYEMLLQHESRSREGSVVDSQISDDLGRTEADASTET